ncbi:MAG: YjgP/YjgQ family permease, partial [Bacteroidales bacterium]|nr:YjgP/YjgQ family permease [Bacteroidales bacterium]
MNKLDLRLKRLDWYIIKKFLGTFFFCFLVIVVVVIIIDISEKIDDFVDNEAPIRAIVFNYYLNFIPYIVNMFSPLFVFITVIFFTSKMANNSEIIAMLSCGESFGRLMYPYLLSAAVIAFMSLMLGLYVIPPANKVRLQFQQEYIKHHPTYITDRNIHYQLSPGNYVYLESFSSWNNSAYRMTLETMEDNKIKSKLTADRAAWDTTFNGWRLSNCFLREYDMYGNQSLKTFETLDTVISLTIEDFLRREDIVETLNAPRLNELIATQRVRGDKMVDYTLIEKHKRLSMP